MTDNRRCTVSSGNVFADLGFADPDAELAKAELARQNRQSPQRRDEVEDTWEGHDPERVRAGLRGMAGIITPEQAERMKQLVYRSRI